MGVSVKAELVRPGFYPAGGGEFTVEIQPPVALGGEALTGKPPSPRLRPLELLQRGEILTQRARAIVARLPDHIAERELKVVEKRLGWTGESLAVEQAHDSVGPGNIVMLEIASRNVTEVFTAFGERDVRAEAVAHKAVDEARAYLAAGVPVGPHLADQLLIPLAMAGGQFRTVAPTRHTTTNIEVIQKFMDVRIEVSRVEHDAWEVSCG
jgi:RNA 3'-terminal phosphate cyclase (ATP)